MSEETFLEADVEEDDYRQEVGNGGIRKNLLDDFADIAKTDSSISNNGRECMKVYLRIRPFTDEEKELANNHHCMEKDGETAILLNAPKDSFTFKNEKRGREVTHRFTFSHVFGSETTQKEFFDSTSLEMVKDFMDGQNCLVFTYGVTNSGKTYTIQGTPKDGGILPRTLDVLFNSIQDRHYGRMNLKPRYFCDVVKIDDKQEHKEIALRMGLLLSLNKEHFDLNSFLQLEDSNNDLSKASSIGDESSLQMTIKSQEGDNIDTVMQDDEDIRTTDETSVSVETQGPVKFSVWVSFAEIYNEQIFDLLEPCPEGKGKKRSTLKVGDDKNGNPYIKGLKEICVSNAEEAYKILRVGKKNQRIASTKLNQNSSRSHCIFSVKVLRVVDVEDPHVARVSRLSFVDLAGSERYTKTHSTGDRLKESGNINTSLMTLGKCLESLRYNQIHPNNLQIIPFRESKLTRLFQGFFCGKGKACMIVNINQCANTFDETYHALKFSAIAKQVTTRVCKPVDLAPPTREKSFRPSFAFPSLAKVPRFSISWVNGALTTPAPENDSNDDDDAVDDNGDRVTQYIQQLENLVKHLESELIEEKRSKATLELKIREEVCAEMAQQLVAIETAYSERIQDEVSAVEEKCEKRIEILAKSIKKTRKRARIERPDDDEEEQLIVQLRSEKDKVMNLTAQISELSSQLAKYESKIESMKTVIEENEKNSKKQEDVMVDLQSALETSSKELGIAKLKFEKRDKMLKEKDDLISKLQEQLKEQARTIEEKSNLLEQKATKIVALENDLSQHQQALDDNEGFLGQLNDQVKQLSSELTDVKNKNQENDELHNKDIKIETALAKKISKLREQLLAKDELMKELVKSLEETRSQVELEKGDLVMVCNQQKKKIHQLERDLEAERQTTCKNQDTELESLKEKLKKAEDKSSNAKEEIERNCFEKEELQLSLDVVNAKLTEIEQEAKIKSDKAKQMLKSLEEANARVVALEEAFQMKNDETQALNDKVESLQMSNLKEKELFVQLQDKVSRQEKALIELEELKQLKTKLDAENDKIISTLEYKEADLKKAEREDCCITEQVQLLAKENEQLRTDINSEMKGQVRLAEEIDCKEKDMKALKQINKMISEWKEGMRLQLVQLKKDVLEKDMLIKDMYEKVFLEVERKKERQNIQNESITSELEQLQKKLSNTVEENDELKTKLLLAEKVTTVEEKVGELAQREGSSDKAQRLEKQLQATTIALDKKNSQLISRNNTVKRLEILLSEKEAKVSELTKSQAPLTPGHNLRFKEEIKTLRKRLLQADKDAEENKQNLESYETKMVDLNKNYEETQHLLKESQNKTEKLQEYVKNLEDNSNKVEEKVFTIEKELKIAKEKLVELKGVLDEKEIDFQLLNAQHKNREVESSKEVEMLRKELQTSHEKLEEIIQQAGKLKMEAQNNNEHLQEVKLQHSDEIKQKKEEYESLVEKMKIAETDLAKRDDKLKDFQDSKFEEVTKLQELIEVKEKLLTQKSELLQELQKKFTENDKEKSEELDKVWKTMVELQDIIKQRGQTIDDLEEKLSKSEARHGREKTTLENTVAKMKEVMETKGGDRKKLLAQISELETKVKSLNESNNKIIQGSEQSENDLQELRKVLEQQDAVMEEQQEALNERQSEIDSLMAENTMLLEKLDAKDSNTESTTTEVRRLEDTLAAFKDEQMTKVEMCRDHEKEKSQMLIRLEKKEGNLSKVKIQVKSLQGEKKALEKRLQNCEAKQQEYESLCQMKDEDIRAANEEKDVMLKAMREALAVASSKKEEFDEKIKALKEDHKSEIANLRKQFEVDITSKMLSVHLTKIEETTENQLPKLKQMTEKCHPSTENEKSRKQRCTTRSRKEPATSSSENDLPSNREELPSKENANEEVLTDITSNITNNSIKILRDEPIPDNRIEIDVTPMQRRKRASRAATNSKSKPRKRRSSELPLSEVKLQLCAKRSKQESEDEFTPGSMIRTRRATRTSSASSSCSSRKKPPVTSMTPMNQVKGDLRQSSVKKPRFFGKLFPGSNLDENTPPRRGRRLLKKDISAPMDSFSPCIASVTTSTSKNKAGSIIKRQLRSRIAKN